MQEQQIKDVVQRYVNAWSTGETSFLENCFSEKATYFDNSLNEKISVDKLPAHIRRTYEHFPDIRFEVVSCLPVGDDKFLVEWLVSKADLESLFGVKLHAKPSQIYTIDMVAIKNDKIASIYSYYDVTQFELQNKGASFKQSDEPVQEEEKYKGSGLTDDGMSQLKAMLVESMEQERMFLNSELTLMELAEHLGARPNHLSQIINSQFGMNFFNFVNWHRVEEAKKLLVSKDYDNLPILNVVYDSGFKSTSTFYLAFRKFAGMNPMEYKQSHLNS